jgi:hypothetical protein
VTDVGLHTGLSQEKSQSIHDGEGERAASFCFKKQERYMAIYRRFPIKQGIENIELKDKYIKSLGTKFEIKVS